MSKIAIISHSTNGHTKLQAEAVGSWAQRIPLIAAKLHTAGKADARLHEFEAGDAIVLDWPTWLGRVCKISFELNRGTLVSED